MGTIKYIRKIFAIIFSCFLLLGCIDQDVKILNKNIVGNYEPVFELSSGNFSEQEKKMYSNTLLKFKENGDFLVSGFLPNNMAYMGKWKIIGTSISRRLRIDFKCGFQELDVCPKQSCVLLFLLNTYKNDMVSGHKKLAFRKMGSVPSIKNQKDDLLNH